MNVKEKILLVQLLLEDIRGNWGWENTRKKFCSRAIKARDLCNEIASELGDDKYVTLAKRCDGYIATYFEDGDGRYFREPFPYGYMNMDDLHGLRSTYMDKSGQFKLVAEKYLTYPEHRFDDWEEHLDD